MKVQETLAVLREHFPGEELYFQAVAEVLATIEDEYNKHPEFEAANLVERLCVPDRIVTFRVTWVDDKGKVQTNMGYRVQHYQGPVKRYCQTLSLVNDPELIQKYVEVHSNVWPEIIEGQRKVGILDMQIFIKGNLLFMICDTIDEFDWERDMARLATLPRQAEWEAYVAQFQGCRADARADEKWLRMERIF